MARRPRPKKHQNHERWLITYSDLITLLLVFFIIMFAMSDINKVRFATLAQSLAQALDSHDQIPLQGMGTSALLESGDKNNGTQFPSNITLPSQSAAQATQLAQNSAQMNHLYNEVKSYIANHNLQKKVAVADEARGVQITLKDVGLFGTGQAILQSQAKLLIEGFIPFFKQIPNDIVVEGYTDNQPIDTPIYPSNWELSAGRAMSVVHFLNDEGINPVRLSGTGYGQYHNVAPNNTPANRQLNRRVNIVVLRENLAPGTEAAMP